jgi:hypothetical protein
MNWKTEAIDKLKQYDAMRCSLDTIPQELQRLQLRAQSLKSLDLSSPVVRSGNQHDDALINNLVHRQELESTLEQACLWVTQVEQALTVLTPDERLVLDVMYIKQERNAVDKLCQELCRDTPTIYRRRDKALRKFTLALYGSCPS